MRGGSVAARSPLALSAPASLRSPEDLLRHPVGGVAAHRRGDVGVDLAGDVGAGVVEAVADDLDVDAGLEGEGGPGVAEAVEAELRQRSPGGPG